ncbi:MAG: DUF1631 family protein [Gammaproteobacteria bacterium]
MSTLAIDPVLAAHTRAAIRHAIEESDGPIPPIFVVQFLLNDWQRYLCAMRDTHGEDSVEMSDALEATTDLLWSVMPMLSEAEKTALRTTLPGLVKSVKRGMAAIDLPEEEQSAFLQQLREWHAQLLSGKGGYEAITATFDPTRAQSSDDTIQLRAHDLKCRELMDMLDNAAVEHIDMDSAHPNRWSAR